MPDGRRVYGRDPGRSRVTLLEHLLRDELAIAVQGVTEAALPYGRADVLTERAVYEVEPAHRRNAHLVSPGLASAIRALRLLENGAYSGASMSPFSASFLYSSNCARRR